MSVTTNDLTTVEDLPPEIENQNHTYRTHRIHWFVHVIWVGFWLMAIFYVLYWQFPIIPLEIKNPP
jgi:hypothetical protein